MATISRTFFSAFITVLLIGCSGGDVQDMTKFKQVTNKFAWNLYKEVKNPSGNTFVSPISLQLLLDVLLHGANGTTATEIASVLQHEAGDKSVLDGYKQFMKDLYSKQKRGFNLAAAIALDDSFSLLSEHSDILDEYFLTETLVYNFKEDPESSRTAVNEWVEVNTDGRITDLLPEGSIDSNTEMVMLSGIQFKGIWKKKFNKKHTDSVPFYVKPNVTVNVKMMGMTNGRFRFKWDSALGAQIVELPYTEDGMRMIIILPNEKFGLAEVENKITNENLSELISSLRETTLDFYLPKFRIKKSFKLANVLKKMGMPTAFSKHADFSKMTNSSVTVSSVMHKAMIVVNEKGTEAAAGSGVVITAKTLPLQVLCDSPFLYIILKGDIIIFIGSFLKP